MKKIIEARAEYQEVVENMRKWAESLIVQLPENHEGRNSWLMNYGSIKSETKCAHCNSAIGHTSNCSWFKNNKSIPTSEDQIFRALRAIEDKFSNVEAWKGIINAKIQNFSNDLGNHIDSNRHELQSIYQTIGELSVKSKHPLFLYNEEKPIKSSFIPTSNTVKAEEWKPPHDEFYYYITSEMYVSKTRNSGFVADDQRIKDGNCFRTKEQAEHALDRVKRAIRGI